MSATHLTEEEIIRIDNAEWEESKKIVIERLKMQSLEWLQNWKIEWKIL